METLVNIGAVEFLSHLRRDIEPSLYQYIDDVLTSLLSLPEVLDSDDNHLHYDKGKPTVAFDPETKSASPELMHKQTSAEIQLANEECSISVQNLVDEIQSIPAGQKWQAGNNRFWKESKFY